MFDDLYENKKMLLTYKYASDFIASLKMWCFLIILIVIIGFKADQ